MTGMLVVEAEPQVGGGVGGEAAPGRTGVGVVDWASWQTMCPTGWVWERERFRQMPVWLCWPSPGRV